MYGITVNALVIGSSAYAGFHISQDARNINRLRHSPMLLIHFNCEIGKGHQAEQSSLISLSLSIGLHIVVFMESKERN